MRIGAVRRWGRGHMAAIGAAMLTAVLVGCSGGGGTPTTSDVAQNKPAAPGGGSGDTAPPAVPAAQVALQPANGTRDVSPNTPVTVRASAGKLTSVAVRNDAGRQVRGTWSADRTLWTSAEVLGYAKTYAITAVAVNTEGKQAREGGRFTTVTPATYTMPYLFPSGLKTVGVGQPITVHFDEAIADKAAAERALSVTTSPRTEGGWNWFDDQNVHWRPRVYWRPGTKVTVAAKVYGVHVGNSIYGQADARSSFTIGPSRILTIDDRTHRGVARINGRAVRTIPVSMGRGGSVTVNGRTIYFTTQSGPHVVQEKHAVKKMSSASYGLPVNSPLGYEENIALAVRISQDGEFAHSAPWSVGDQGVRNVSHGCVNMSPANARWFYDTFTYGDVVDIKNTSAKLHPSNKYGDWMVSWSTWLEGSALR